MKKTKIVATVGPACEKESMLKAMVREGADVFRINASHTNAQGLKYWIRKIRKATRFAPKPVSILVDLQGPRVRTGRLKDGKPVTLKKGDKVSILPSSKAGSGNIITTTCREFPRMVKSGDRILIDNGLIELEAISVKKVISCKVVMGGILGENKGINLPSAPVTLPAIGPKDQADLEAAVEGNVDYIALSFVRSEKDVLAVKKWLGRRGKNIPVIAKIEKPRAVDHIQSIVEISDGIMVARGDLGIEMGVERVPVIQKTLITEANRRYSPVITATQMLESMMESPRPTRAEASDIANAVFDGTDAVMLSGETAIGKYPLEAVRTMSKIVLEAENHLGEIQADLPSLKMIPVQDLFIRAITHAARHAAKDLGAKAVVVFTMTGKTVRLIAKFRPLSLIIAVSPNIQISRRLSLYRGVLPLQIKHHKNVNVMIRQADNAISRLGLLKKGDPVVLLSGKNAFPYASYTVKIHRIGEPH